MCTSMRGSRLAPARAVVAPGVSAVAARAAGAVAATAPSVRVSAAAVRRAPRHAPPNASASATASATPSSLAVGRDMRPYGVSEAGGGSVFAGSVGGAAFSALSSPAAFASPAPAALCSFTVTRRFWPGPLPLIQSDALTMCS